MTCPRRRNRLRNYDAMTHNVKRDEAIESKAVSLTWEILLLGIDLRSE